MIFKLIRVGSVVDENTGWRVGFRCTPVGHCSLYSGKSPGSCRACYKSIFTLWRTTFLSRLCISLSWRKALTQSVLPAALSPIISQCDPHFTHSQHPKAELCSAQQTTYKHKHKNKHKHLRTQTTAKSPALFENTSTGTHAKSPALFENAGT